MLPAEIAEKTPQEHFSELRHWILATCNAGHPVRQASYMMSLTAHCHRFIKYGPDKSLDHLTARDLMNLLIYTNGEVAEWIMRAAFTRSIIENDEAVTLRLANSPFIIECTTWYWKLIEGITGSSINPDETTNWLESLPLEEQSIARLIIARVFPDTANINWLHDIPDSNPMLQWKLAEIIAQKADNFHATENFLRERPFANCQQYA